MTRWISDKPILKFSPDGNWIVAPRVTFGATGFRLELWDALTGEHVASFPSEREVPEHVGVISAIAFSADGKSLATASWDHSVRLWNLEERRCVRKFQGTLSEVWSVTFAPDGKHIISGAKDGTVTFWPLEDEREETLVAGDWMPLGFSPDSRLLAMLGNDQTLAFFNLRTHEIERRVALPERPEKMRNPFLRPEITQDFSKIAVPSAAGSIRIFDIGSDQPVETRLPTGVNRADSVTLSPDGLSLVTGEWGEGLAWWRSGQNSDAPRKLPGNRALFAKNGKTMITTEDGGLRIWDAISGNAVTNFTTDSFLGSVALSADGLVFAAGSDPQDVENAIRLWDTRTGKFLGICAGHTQGVGRLAFSPDGKTLASTSTDGTLRFWNVQTQQQLLAVGNMAAAFSDLLFSPDGAVLITRTPNGVVALNAPHDDK
jgi:WD40 repeat protein